MFDETQKQTKPPWYLSRPVMLAAPVLVVVLVGVGVYLLFGAGHATDPGTEAHYAELERQRAEQRASAPATGAPAAAVDPQASQPADPNAQPAAGGAAQPADPGAQAASA